MTETQVNLRRQPLPTAVRQPSDHFRYAGVMVALAAAAALLLVFLLREAPVEQPGIAVAAELPQIQ